MTRFDLEGMKVDLRSYQLTNLENPPETVPGLMETGKAADVLERYTDRPDLVHNTYGKDLVNIPYAALHSEGNEVFGNFSTAEGQDAFADADVVIESDQNALPEWATDLHRFAALKLARRFSLDEELTGLRGLERKNGRMQFTVGPSKYSEAFFSMGSEGVTLDLSPADIEHLKQKGVSSEHLAEIQELHGKLAATHGEGRSIRDAIFEKTGGLPDYNRRVHHYLLGVAGTVLTRNGDLVFVNRGASVSVNRGINVTASGGVKYKKDFLAREGLQRHLGRQMHEETKEEIGLQSGDLLLGSMHERMQLELGVDVSDYDLIPVGMARELPRGGSPETMFLIKFKGDTDDLIQRIATNTHEDRHEIDSLVHALPMETAGQLLKQADAERVIQHKGLLNLMMIDAYLRNHS